MSTHLGRSAAVQPPATSTRTHLLIEGRVLMISALRRGDVATVHGVFDQLGDESRLRRYLTLSPRLAEPTARALADVDGVDHQVLVVHEAAGTGGTRLDRPIALARLVRTGRVRAEVALEVVDRWQGRGLGTELVRRLLQLARTLGVEVVEGTASADNRAVLRLVARHLGRDSLRYGDGLVEFEGPTRGPLVQVPLSPETEVA